MTSANKLLRRLMTITVTAVIPGMIAFGHCLLLAIDAANPRDAEFSGKVRAAWERRENEIQSFVFEWTEQPDISAVSGANNGVGSNSANMFRAVGPPEDLRLAKQGRVAVSGRQGRYWEAGPNWSFQNDSLTPMQQTNFVASNGMSINFSPYANASFPTAHISPADEPKSELAGILEREVILPISLCYRVLHPSFHVFSTDRFVVQMLPSDPGGEPHALATIDVGAGSSVRLWLSPERGFVPKHYEFRDPDGQTSYELDIEYGDDSESAPVPIAWKSRINADSLPRMTREIAVTHSHLNGKVSRDEFEIAIPRGCWVYDDVNKAQYVVRSDGSHYTVKRGEGMAHYKRMYLASGSWSAWRIFLAVAILVVVFVWFARCQSRSTSVA